MKVAVVSNMAPFVWGGAEELAVHLAINLEALGHHAEIIRIPFQWEPPAAIPSQVAMVRSLDLINADHVVALKFPAYLIRHQRKTIWLLHQFRQAYDLSFSDLRNLNSDSSLEPVTKLIHKVDNSELGSAKRLFCNSPTTQARLKNWNGITAEVLRPPVNDPEIFTGGQSRGFIFCGGRINTMKRQDLLIRALAEAKVPLKLVVAGPPDSEEDGKRIRDLVIRLGLEDQVHLDLNFISRQKYANYVNESLAVAYVPLDEDSLGYVAMEAAHAKKPLITTSDSGGLLDLVIPNSTGWICEANPLSIGKVFDELFFEHDKAQRFGLEARRTLDQLVPNWEKVVGRLLA